MKGHTPGPWKATDIETNNSRVSIYSEDGSRHIINMVRSGADGVALEDTANARLIAAAPELLEASQKAWDAMKQQVWKDGNVLMAPKWIAEPMNDLIDAIKKAKGV